ncbi:MAG: 7,8-didemethyl-8-hydroxy-5-deazariboflavin synthase subunit CofG [Promethearchaeota archaeon]
MTINRKTPAYFNNLSLKKIKNKIGEIRTNLPLARQGQVTYSKNFTLSISNYCQNLCGYCFYNYKVPKLEGEGNVIIIGNDQMNTLIQQGLRFDCKEALIMSGERPDTFEVVKKELETRNCQDYIAFILDICSYLLDFNILPHTNIGLNTYDELAALKNFNASMGLMLESTNEELFKKGNVHEHSPGKKSELRIEHIKNAGKLKIPFTTGLLLGIGERFEDRINDLYLIKEIHEEFDHIQEVIIQNFVPKEGIPYQPEKLIDIEETLKIAGIAKLIFENEIAVQVPPNLIRGFEIDAIELGIDDFGGISPFTVDYINPEHSWPQIAHLKRICERAGFKLKERLPIYKKYIDKPGFCSETIKKTIDNINLDDSDN